MADEGVPSGRTALATVRALAAGGYAPWVTVARRRTLASSSRWCAGSLTLPPPDLVASAGEASWLHEAAARLGALTVLPASDRAVAALAQPGSELLDKRVVRRRAADAGLPVPDELELADMAAVRARAEELDYPAVLKPAVKSDAPFDAVRVDDPAGLEGLPDLQRVIVQPFLAGGITAVDLLVLQGRLVASVHQRYTRIWPPDCGVSSAAVTVEPDLRLEEQLLTLVEGLEGIVQVQLIDGHVMDVNPRVYGSLPLAVRAGVNFPVLWCRYVEAGEVPPSIVRARVGVHYRWLDADVRAIAAQLRGHEIGWGQALSALLPRSVTAHSIAQWHDPLPALVRATQIRGRG